MNESFMILEKWFEANGTIGLAINSALESFLLVPPPDFLLIGLDLANPEKALYYASICTFASAFGGVIGWLIGKFGGRPIFNWFFKKNKNFLDKLDKMYEKWGSACVLAAAFTPLPYKVFTIGSGVLNMNLIKFTAMSIIGRGARFFFVSILLMLFGETVKQYLKEIIAVASVILVIFFYIVYKIMTKKKLTDKRMENIERAEAGDIQGNEEAQGRGSETQKAH